MKQFYTYNLPFTCESGEQIPKLEIAYHTYGRFDPVKNNVVWIFHALTANSDPCEWWNGLTGTGKLFNPEEHFIVCANIIGSCYGSSGPLSLNPKTRKPFYSSFPEITIRDMVKAHQLLQNHLGIRKIKFGLGGSMGAYQLLEWSIAQPGLFENIVLLTTSAKESPWGKAIHTAQRLAIEADSTWKNEDIASGKNGLKAARAIGMLTYRNYEIFGITQKDEEGKLNPYKAESYIRYQGEKLAKRFNACSYYLLTKAMDSHDISRGRKPAEEVLKEIQAKTLVIGISSDILCPLKEQEHLAANIPGSRLETIDSPYGHDGFLVEDEKISSAIRHFFSC